MNDDSIKLMSLLEELEDLITSSSKMPFSEKGIIDLDVATKILSDAKKEYNRMINEAKDQVEYLVNNNNIYKDAQRRADAILKEAENHANYMKYRSYEYIDQLLYDMQTDIASVSGSYIQPMTEYFNQMFSNINAKVNQNRQEMKTLAERVRLGDQPAAEAPETAEEE